jgi:hypothetical protein
MARPVIDLTGQRFGRLFVEERAEGAGRRPKWRCRCDCGAEKVIFGGALRQGLTRSCGCYMRERSRERMSPLARKGTHHRSRTPEYGVWSGIKGRCLNPRSRSFGDYGARGVYVAARWVEGVDGLSGFECFIADMGERPTPTSTIDRIDPTGPYSPANCRWVEKASQNRNKRNTVRVEFAGEEIDLRTLCERHGVPYGRARDRLRRGWTVADAINVAPKKVWWLLIRNSPSA